MSCQIDSPHATCPHDLAVADVHFRLGGPVRVGPDAFPAFFQPFAGLSATADLCCRVEAAGPDAALATLPAAPAAPWLFTVREGACELVRRDEEGVVLWRIHAPLSFEEATVSWHPVRFPAVYGCYEKAWGVSLGITLLIFRLRAHGGLAFHGTAAELDGCGILCAGASGTGKSTLARLLAAAGASVLSDERPILRQWPPPGGQELPPSPAAFRVYGSPWPSSGGFVCNAFAPLRKIYFLEHGAADRLTPLTPREAFNRLIHVATIPWQDPALFDPCLATVEALLQSIPCAVLSFRPTPEVVEVIRKDLGELRY